MSNPLAEFLSLPAGLELDYLVLQHIFGWQPYLNASGKQVGWRGPRGTCMGCSDVDEGRVSPSRDAEPALRIMENLRARDWGIRMFMMASWQANRREIFHVIVDRPDRIGSYTGNAENFPLALVRAALAAIQGDEIPIGPSYRRVIGRNGVAQVAASEESAHE